MLHYNRLTYALYVFTCDATGASTKSQRVTYGGNASGITTGRSARVPRMVPSVRPKTWIKKTAAARQNARRSWVSKLEFQEIALIRVPQALHAQVFSTGKRVGIGGNAFGGVVQVAGRVAPCVKLRTVNRKTALVRRSAKVTCCQGSARTRARIRVKRARIFRNV